MISGFVILMSAQGRSPSEFVASRVVRLYPTYWFAVLFTALVMYLYGGSRYPIGVWQVLINLSMLQSFFGIPDVDGVYWTLARELVFYFWVWVLLLMSGIERFSFWAAIFLSIATLAVLVKFPGSQSIFLTDYSCYFVGGAAFYLLHKDGYSPGTLILILWSMALAAVNLILNTRMYTHYFNTHFSLWVAISALVLFYLFFFSITNGLWIRFTSKHAVTLGTLTYPLYLLHENIGFIVFNHMSEFMNKYILVISMMTTAIMFSYVVVRWVEKPLKPGFKRIAIKLLQVKPRA
jgi:peptidoglycan/LPS O-acetylase OafA/YrhL